MGGLGPLGGFLTPDVEGCWGSFLILETGVVASCLMMMGTVGSFFTPLIICFNKLSAGVSTIPSGCSVPLYAIGPVVPVRKRFTNRFSSEAKGLIILTAMLSGIRLSFRMRCSSAARRPALFRRAFSVICPL